MVKFRALFCFVALSVCMPQPAFADDVLKNITVEVSPDYTLSATPDQSPNNSFVTTHDLKLDGDIAIALGKGTRVYYDRRERPFTLGRVFAVYTPVGPHVFPTGLYPASGDDRFENVAVAHRFDSSFEIEAGYFKRTRQCCPADGDPTTLAASGYHGEFIGGNYRFLRYGRRKQPLFTYTFRALEASHPPDDAVLYKSLPRSDVILGSRLLFPQSITLNVPFGQPSLIPFITYAHASDYFQTYAKPDFDNVFTYGFARPINRFMNFHAAVYTVKEPPDGIVFPGGNTVYFTNITAGFTFRTNL